MRNGSRRSGDPTTSPRSASLDDTYLSSPMKRGQGKTHSRMAVRFSVTGRQSRASKERIRSLSALTLASISAPTQYFPPPLQSFFYRGNKYIVQ